MPKGLIYASIVLVILAMIPPAIIARTRSVNNKNRRIHIVLDMDIQGKFGPQDVNHTFADRRAMRPPVDNTLSREDAVRGDSHYHRGVVSGPDGQPAWATVYPTQTPVSIAFIKHGQERFNIYCRPCHGYGGFGDGIVSARAMQLMASGQSGTTWVQPKNIHEPLIRAQPPGQIFNTITHGIRNMSGYEAQIPVQDRWAIVAYVKALQLSQSATLADVPVSRPDELPLEPLPPGAQPAPATGTASAAGMTSTQETQR